MRWRQGVLNAFQAVFLVAWSMFWISLALILSVLTLNRSLPLAMARRCWAPGLIWGAGVRLRVEPLPRVDWSAPHIFVMNHESMIDIPIAFAVLPPNIRFVAKKVLKYVPFLGWYMWLTGMVFVDRTNRSQATGSLTKAGAQIRNGATILAYPEGTRSVDGTILPFKKGPFVVALAAGVPVIPVAISGSGRVLPSGGFSLRAGEIRVKIGAPIETLGRPPGDREALLREVRSAVIALHREIGGAGGDDEAIAAPGVEGRAVRRG